MAWIGLGQRVSRWLKEREEERGGDPLGWLVDDLGKVRSGEIR